MTTTLGLSFSARSVAKKFILFALNITILLLGVACSVLCLYQVKLMPENYENIRTNLIESNVTDLRSARIKMPPQAFTQRSFITIKLHSHVATKNKHQVIKSKPRSKTTRPLKQTTTPKTSPVPTTTTTITQRQRTNPVIPKFTVSALELSTTNSNKDDESIAAGLKSYPPYSRHLELSSASTSPTSTTTTTVINVTTDLSTTVVNPIMHQSSSKNSTGSKTTLMSFQSPLTSSIYFKSNTTVSSFLVPSTKPKPTTYANTTPNSSEVDGIPKPALSNNLRNITTASEHYDNAANISPTHQDDVQGTVLDSASFLSPEASKLANNSTGVLNEPSAFEQIASLLQQDSLSNHSKRKRDVFPSSPQDSSSRTTQTVIPPHFQEIFELVQTSLYTCTAAGVLIFFSSLIGICGGLFRVNGCLKFSVGALVVVIIGEMATVGFVFFAHDKASNRSKYKHFNEDFKVLCDMAHFCINEMMLIMVGSFLCVSVVLQIGSITLSCHLMDNVYENDTDLTGKGWRKGALNRADLQMTNGMMPFAHPMAMHSPFFAGQNMPYSYSATPMYGMGCFQPPMGPGQRPIINIIS